MAIETLASPPSTATAGDSYQWSETLSDYDQSEGWSVSYWFRDDAGGSHEIAATGAATVWTATLNGADTADWAPGVWSWACLAKKASDRATVSTGHTTVRPDPARPHEETELEKRLGYVEAAIEARLTDDKPERYTIAGQSVDKIPLETLWTIRANLRGEVAAERNRDRLRRGLPNKRLHKVRFR